MFEPSDFGLLLKEKRKSRKMQQDELSEMTGKSTQYISNIEMGKNKAPGKPDVLKALSDALGLVESERAEFYFKAAKDRNTLPDKYMKYIFENDNIIDLIYYGEKYGLTNSDWLKILESFPNGKEFTKLNK